MILNLPLVVGGSNSKHTFLFDLTFKTNPSSCELFPLSFLFSLKHMADLDCLYFQIVSV